MDKPSSDPIALQRWGLVNQVLELLRRHWPLSAALEHTVASSPLLLDDGSSVVVSKRTLQDWFYKFQRGGFDSLRPKARKDRGRPRRLSPDQQQRVLDQVRAFPGIHVKLLYKQWKESDPTLPAIASIYRWLDQNQLDAHGRRYLLRNTKRHRPHQEFRGPGGQRSLDGGFLPGPLPPGNPQGHRHPLVPFH